MKIINKTKKGAASIYVVAFITLLLGVITIGFVRVVLREARNTTDDELSESARDSALTGIEDAKRAIKKYYDCQSNSGGERCGEILTFDMSNCTFVGQVLGEITPEEGDPATKEVLIKSTTSSDKSPTEQAYTCVTVSDHPDDYLGTLSPTQTVAIIPLRAKGEFADQITFSWHTARNISPNNFVDQSGYPQIQDNNPIAPAVISLQYIGETPHGTFETDTLFLNPSESARKTTGQFSSNPKDNSPIFVKCDGTDYKCSFSANVISRTNAKFLVVSLPYGTPETDFKVEMKKSGNTLQFYGVQFVVDSTGRANDMFARIETRLMNTDPNFPYPQFALQIGDGGIKKNFWATKHCKKIDNDRVNDCNNSGDL